MRHGVPRYRKRMEFNVIDITRDLVTTPVYPGDPEPRLAAFSSIPAGDVCNIAVLTTALHCGTHVDAPLHFIASGDPINAYDPGIFVGECKVVEVPPGRITGEYVDRHFPKGYSRVLLKSGGKAYFDKTGAEEAAYFGIKLIGTDANSVGCAEDQVGPHQAFLRENVALLENLDLSRVKPGNYFLIAPPVKIAGVEAAPARALLLEGYIFWSGN